MSKQAARIKSARPFEKPGLQCALFNVRIHFVCVRACKNYARGAKMEWIYGVNGKNKYQVTNGESKLLKLISVNWCKCHTIL